MARQIQAQVYMPLALKQITADFDLDTYEYVKLNPDTFAPPGTDSGDIPQAQ